MPKDMTGIPVPDHLTAGGRQAFENEMARHARALIAELARQAAGPLDRQELPEHTKKDVEVAVQAVYAGRLDLSVNEDRQARTPLLAAILLTLSSVGVGVMPSFLFEPWQYALFVLLIGVGLVGLLLTWVGGTKAKRGSPPVPGRATAARLDG